jgi:hypothetical protein
MGDFWPIFTPSQAAAWDVPEGATGCMWYLLLDPLKQTVTEGTLLAHTPATLFHAPGADLKLISG